jgi:sugar lactone lactonase YvrE
MSNLPTLRRALLTVLLILLAATPAQADLKVVSVFGTPGSAPGQLNGPKDVTTDAQGNVYVANESNARVDKYASDGTYLQSFGSSGSQPGQLSLPVGVAVAPAGQVWVSDFDGTRGRITVYNPDGSLVRTFGSAGSGDGQFRSPGAITLDPTGNAYVVDTGNHRVEKFAPDGTFITKWGSQGAADGQFNNPRGIAIDSDGAVVVADRDNQRVERFTQDGAFLGKFGTPVTPNHGFSSVYDVAALPGGGLFTADNGLFDLEKFTNAGAFLFQANAKSSFDGTGATGLRPVAVTVASDGSVYAVGTQSPAFVAKFVQVDPQPVLAQSATVQVLKGTVLVKAPGATSFAPLTSAASAIPMGSSVDASKGTVSMVTATGSGSKTQSGAFNGGMFQVLQKKQSHGLTELVLQGGNFKKVCPGKGVAGAARGASRQLFGNAHGRFRTRGRYSSATVRGTAWLTKDTCKGTLTTVMRGTVTVSDLVKRKNFTVKAGHSYLAKPKH